jgi:hypothetical protein
MPNSGSINDTEINGKWATRLDLHPRSITAANAQAKRLLVISKRKMKELIYDNPIPVGKSGKPKWKRTRMLYRGEKVEVKREHGEINITLVNDVTYAEPRHEAGKPGRRHTNFPAHWRDDAREEFRQSHFTGWATVIGELILGTAALVARGVIADLAAEFGAGTDPGALLKGAITGEEVTASAEEIAV